jgi:hypothetical protein
MIPDNFFINDTRNIDFFKKNTFSNYSKKEVFRTLNKSILNGLIEESCYWSTEIVCSGYISELINQLILFSSDYINIKCLDITEWVINETMDIIKIYDQKHPLSGRNNQVLRNHICNIIFGFCECDKKLIPNITITDNDLSINSIKNKIMHKSTLLVENIISNADPNEIKIVGNEFANQLRKPGSMIRNSKGMIEGSLYWIYWIVKWDKLMLKKLKNNHKCASRTISGVEEKFHNDVIWIIWSIIFNECKFRKKDYITKRITTLFNLFKRDYKQSYKSSRLCHLLHATLLLIEKITPTKEYPVNNTNYHKMVQASGNINTIYKQIKNKSEVIDSNSFLLKKGKKLEVGGYQIVSVGKEKKNTDNNFATSDNNFAASDNNFAASDNNFAASDNNFAASDNNFAASDNNFSEMINTNSSNIKINNESNIQNKYNEQTLVNINDNPVINIPNNNYTLLDFSDNNSQQNWSFMDVPDPKKKNNTVEDDLLMTNKMRNEVLNNNFKNEHWQRSNGPIKVIKKNY